MVYQATLLILLGLGLGALSVALRARGITVYEVKPIDVAIVLIPVIIWLAATGRIQRISIAGVELEAIAKASRAPIEKDIESVSQLMEPIDPQGKGGEERLQQLKRNQAKALKFIAGSGGYVNTWVQRYFDELWPHLKFVVVNDLAGKLRAIFRLDHLRADLSTRTDGYKQFTKELNNGDIAKSSGSTNWRGRVSPNCWAKPTNTKLEALEAMESCQSNALPVVTRNRFVGILDRSKLTAALIIDLSKKAQKRD